MQRSLEKVVHTRTKEAFYTLYRNKRYQSYNNSTVKNYQDITQSLTLNTSTMLRDSIHTARERSFLTDKIPFSDEISPVPNRDQDSRITTLTKASLLDREQLDVFRQIDLDKNGKLSENELTTYIINQMLRIPNTTKNQMKRIVKDAFMHCQKTSTKWINKNEFKYFQRQIKEWITVWNKFRETDKNGNFRLDLKEWKKSSLPSQFGREYGATAKEKFLKMDANNSGSLTADEVLWEVTKKMHNQITRE